MSYTPQPGTIADKVIDFLRKQPSGTVIATAPLLENIGHSELRSGLRPFMEPSIEAGLVRAERRPDDRLVYWRLGDGIPLVRPDQDADDAPPPAREASASPAPRRRRPAIRPDGARQDAAQDWAGRQPRGPEVPSLEEIRRFGLGFGVGVAVRMAERALKVPDDEAKALLVDACIALGRAAFTVETPASTPDA